MCATARFLLSKISPQTAINIILNLNKMKKLSYLEIREKYLNFMKEHNHEEIPNAPLTMENDPTMLFVSAGMVPLVPFLMGEEHPQGERLTNVQRCIRTIDIDEVGDPFHLTSFEMLGNWSLNNYFKEEALSLTIEFFTTELGFQMDNIYASVFKGDNDAPRDEKSIEVWKKIFNNHGIQAKIGKNERIQLLGKKENWWGLDAGGPCGPSSEFFFDTGKPKCSKECDVSCQCGKYIELGNNVFMEYLKEGEEFKPLGRHNVDYGGGLDRQAYIQQEVESIYQTDIYKPIIQKVRNLSKENSVKPIKSERIVTDHIKAATWITMDGVVPGNTEKSYVLRRIIRKAIRHARMLGIEDNFTREIGEIAIKQFSPIYSKLEKDKKYILDVIEDEEVKFRKTLKRGIQKFEELFSQSGKITGEDAFYLYETYGFPIEITQEMAQEKGFTVDKNEFDKAFKEHKEESRQASKGFFKGGLADSGEISKKFHTATHLLNEALREVLGDHVVQKGSNINPERLRFDFSHDKKLTDEEVEQVEEIVNEQIDKGLEVYFEEMPKDKALELAPYSQFVEKYGDTVKVYFVGRGEDNFSVEICGGPHVDNTSELGKFRVKKQENVGAGVRRIKAVLV